jgi:hypothetical protein
MEPPLREPLPFNRSSDDLEELLRAFFQAEVPNPWPALKLPAPETDAVLGGIRKPALSPALGAGLLNRATRRLPLWRSRFALAASVVLLSLASVLVSGTFRGKDQSATDPSQLSARDRLAPLRKMQFPSAPVDRATRPMR